MIKKHLIFHFFIPRNYEANIAIRMHFMCLSMYAPVFDSAEFFISAEEGSEKYIEDVKATLLSIFEWKDIRFKVVENDDFCEARTLKENIVDKLEDFDETLLFFGHTKGVTNVNDYPNPENFLKWVFALYFYSLNFKYEVEKKLLYAFRGRIRTFFGSLMVVDKNKAFYGGTFFWLNPMQLTNDIKNGVATPLKMNNRTYSESFPTMYNFETIDNIPIGRVDGHNCISSDINDFNFYMTDFDDVIRYYGDYENFMERYNHIMSNIK